MNRRPRASSRLAERLGLVRAGEQIAIGLAGANELIRDGQGGHGADAADL